MPFFRTFSRRRRKTVPVPVPPAAQAPVLGVPVVNADRSVDLACTHPGATAFEWYRNGVLVGTTSSPAFTDYPLGPPGGGGGEFLPADLYSEDFEGGTLGQLTNPWGSGITVENDTTGLLGGKVARIDFDINYRGSLDRALAWSIRNAAGVPTRLAYGGVLWARWTVVCGPTSNTAPARKLYDLLPPDNGVGGMRLFVNIRGGAGGVTFGWTADYLRVDGVKDILDSQYTSFPFPGFNKKVVMEVGIHANTAQGVPNGGFWIYADGDLVAERHDFAWMTDNPASAPSVVLIGTQVTTTDVPGESEPVTDVRRIGEVAFSTTRIGP